MPKTIPVRRGNECLSDVQLPVLEQLRGRPGRSRDRLQAAVPEWRSRTLGMARIAWKGISTVHR